MKTKTCTKCGVEKELETGFYKKASCMGGYDTQCKSCVCLRQKMWREKNPESLPNWQKANPDKVKEYDRRKRESISADPNRKAQKEKNNREWREKNPDKVKLSRDKSWQKRVKNDPVLSADRKQRDKVWRLNNPEIVREMNRKKTSRSERLARKEWKKSPIIVAIENSRNTV